MSLRGRRADPVREWVAIPSRLERSIRGLDDEDLDRRGGDEGWSIRETVHHLVEANLVASTMIIAAVGADGCEFDWTWLNPDRGWMRRMGYASAPVAPAINALRAVGAHVAGLIAKTPRSLRRRVSLNDSPGAERYVMTVKTILEQEATHVTHHLKDVRSIRRTHAV